MNLWYLDDGSLAGELETVLADFELVINEGKKMGLDVNDSKCELFFFRQTEHPGGRDSFKILAPGIKVLGVNDAELLGGALGEGAVKKLLEKKYDAFDRMVGNLSLVDRHEGLFLLRNCFLIPKLTYLFRTSACFDAQDLLQKFDSLMKESLGSILNCSLNGTAIDRATLPIKMGGLGIRKPSEVALPAFLSSNFATEVLTKAIIEKAGCNTGTWDGDLKRACGAWSSMGYVMPEDSKKGYQKSWDKFQVDLKYKAILTKAGSEVDRASLIAASSSESGAWLRALPSQSLGLKLQNDHLRIAAALRIGAEVCREHTCICGNQADPYGHHALVCKKVPGCQLRHSELNGVVSRALTSAQIANRREPAGLARENGKRPDGLTLVLWEKGISAIWDVTCVSTTAQSNVKNGQEEAGGAAKAAEEAKIAKYESLGGSYVFLPLGFETLGSFGPSAKSFIAKVGKKLSETTGEKRSTEF